MKKPFFTAIAIAAGALSIIAFKPHPTIIDNYQLAGEKVTLADEASKWTSDKKHSNVAFNVTYMAIAQVSGHFTSFEGTMEHAKADFSDAVINYTVDAASINTDDEGRDKHLKSDDFFNAEQFPTLKFVSKSFKPIGDNKYELAGDLTIRDVTTPVTFDVKYGGSVRDARGTERSGFKARTTINRFDYGIKWASKTPDGGFVVDKDVEIVLNIQMRKAEVPSQR